MTAAEFAAAHEDCAITAVHKAAARTNLEIASRRVRMARMAPPSIQVMAVCHRDNALAVAEEWGVFEGADR